MGKPYRMTRRKGHPLAQRDGQIYVHRLVAWEHYGPFDPACHVHHLNGDPIDNRPENLEVLTPEEHAARHPQARRDWAAAVRLVTEQGLSIRSAARLLGCQRHALSVAVREAA